MEKSRNIGIDQLKVILSMLVVMIHVFPSDAHGLKGLIYYYLSNGISRVAVPIFFMLSGYFIRNKINNISDIRKYLLGILKLFVIWQLMYLIMWLPSKIKNGSWGDILLFVVYGYGPIWYLFSLIFGVILAYLLRYTHTRTKIALAIILYGIGMALWVSVQSHLIADKSILSYLYRAIGTSRNFLFMALPFILLGIR